MKKLNYYLEKYCQIKNIKSYILQFNQKMITFINANNEIIEKSINYIMQEISYIFNIKIKHLRA